MVNVFCKEYARKINENLKKLHEAAQIEKSFIIYNLKTKYQFCLSLLLTGLPSFPNDSKNIWTMDTYYIHYFSKTHMKYINVYTLYIYNISITQTLKREKNRN